ncbi:VOC family protein [Enterococcus sp. LJL51]|uniref:VOC family protein n=1 Tax=Enterococcus sp. LJL51 TaxID=3416656 RepID=UPI003CEA577B
MTTSCYPVLMSQDIQKGAAFFMQVFGFQETFTSDWYISLKNDDDFELALIDSQHDTIPDQYKAVSQGIILNFEVDNVDQLYTEIVTKQKAPILMELQDEDYGQRHFLIESPDKLLIDVIQVIPPSDDYLEKYVETE